MTKTVQARLCIFDQEVAAGLAMMARVALCNTLDRGWCSTRSAYDIGTRRLEAIQLQHAAAMHYALARAEFDLGTSWESFQ